MFFFLKQCSFKAGIKLFKMKLSVVVCSYNREKYIGGALQKLCDQNYVGDDYEIIIVDNNSSDNTPTICSQIIEKNPSKHIKYVTENKQGLTFARNRGIKESRGDLISFIDDDGLCDSSYVQEIVLAFEKNPKAKAIGGKVIPVFPECESPKWQTKYIDGILSKIDLGEKVIPFKKKYPVGCNMVFRKTVFQEVGGFNEKLVLRSDEKDLFIRLKKEGAIILYIPTIRVEHVMSKTRVSKQGVITVSRITGEGEFYRNKGSIMGLGIKFVEYISKLSIVLVLCLFYALKGESIKGKYLVIVGWYILIGFLNSNRSLNPDT